MRLLMILPSLMALLVLAGWAADIEVLRRLDLSSVTMNPLTALSVLALGSGVILRSRPGRLRAAVGAMLIGAGGAVGAVKLLDLACGSHWAIDGMVFSSKLSPGYPQPSRIAPNTALCLLMESVAILLMAGQGARAVIGAQALAIGAGLIAVFAAIGHLYGVDAFYVVGALHPVAMPSAICLLCLSAIVLIGTAERGLVAPIADQGPAGRTSRALLPAAFLAPVAFGWLRQQGERAGLFAGEVGIALMVMLTILTMTVLIWHTARRLLASDRLRLKAEAEVAHMARHDFLTGLPNRGLFMDRLMERMVHRARAPGCFAVITMDLDGFKQVNDRLGHAAGDGLLQQVGIHLDECRRHDEDLVARVGGDEFSMLLDGIDNAADAAAVAARIVSGMPGAYGPPDQQVPVGISVGIVVAGPRHQTPEALLADADLALYQAKHGGKGRFAVIETIGGVRNPS